MSSEIVSSIARLARTDPTAWADKACRLGLINGAGTSLKASHPGWNDATVEPDSAAILLSHPDAEPEDAMRCFRSEMFCARLTVIARNGMIGCHAVHDCGAEAVCHDLSQGVWSLLETAAA